MMLNMMNNSIITIKIILYIIVTQIVIDDSQSRCTNIGIDHRNGDDRRRLPLIKFQ